MNDCINDLRKKFVYVVYTAVNCLNADLITLLVWCYDHGSKMNVANFKPIALGTSRKQLLNGSLSSGFNR